MFHWYVVILIIPGTFVAMKPFTQISSPETTTISNNVYRKGTVIKLSFWSHDLFPQDFHFWATAQVELNQSESQTIEDLVDYVRKFVEFYETKILRKVTRNALKWTTLCIQSDRVFRLGLWVGHWISVVLLIIFLASLWCFSCWKKNGLNATKESGVYKIITDHWYEIKSFLVS